MGYEIRIYQKSEAVVADEVTYTLPPAEGWGVFEESSAEWESTSATLRNVHDDRPDADRQADELNESEGVLETSSNADEEIVDRRVRFYVGAVKRGIMVSQQIVHTVGYETVK